MQRRALLKCAGLTAISAAVTRPVSAQIGTPAPVAYQPIFAGLTLSQLRDAYRKDLFERFMPFWQRYGVDHQYGGFMCRLDNDGTLVDSSKFHWFQGRGIFVWSFVYNHLDKNPEYLATARKAKEFLYKYAAQPDGWWAEVWARDGKILKPFSGDTYGMIFAAEGFQEYAVASGDDEARQRAFDLVHRVFKNMDSPDFRFSVDSQRIGGQARGATAGVRVLGQWFIMLQVVTAILKRWPDPSLETIADRCVDAVVHKHYNPDIEMLTEARNYDFTSPAGEETKCLLGHAIECSWILMFEAQRRKDSGLYAIGVDRARRHFDIAWDSVYGGIAEWINVDHGCYDWPVERPADTNLEYHFHGEYEYMKSMWAEDEALIAFLHIYETTGAPWAAEYFSKVYKVVQEKFSLESHGYPTWMMFCDRKMTYQPHASRQENYHNPRQFMFNLVAIERMLRKYPQVSGESQNPA